MKTTRPLEICILAGEQVGARAKIQIDKSVVISSELDGDIVLRDMQLVGQRIRITVQEDYANIEILSGNIDIEGKQYTVNDLITVAAYTPFKIGRTILAYGECDEGRWEKLKQMIADSSDNDELFSAHYSVRSRIQQQEKVSLGKGRKGWLMGLLLLLSGVGFIAVNANSETNTQVLKSQSEMASDISNELEIAGFKGLEVEKIDKGGFIINGDIDTIAQRVLLEKTIEEMNESIGFNVSVKEQLVTTVQELYRINGVKAEVHSLSPGVVQVKTQEADLDKLEQLVKTAKRDISGLHEIVVENTQPKEKPNSDVMVDDPGKRVASVVPGNPAYLVTVDGARYFVGAIMPSGHIISAISEQQVMLDKSGKVTTLEF